ncbi:MAG: SDR family NAD(P)-dependent oxidoreductase [Alphaproteobacteria bacterium]
MNKESGRPALVLGASGGFGGALAREMAARGWRVRLYGRSAARLRQRFGEVGIETVNGDVQDASMLAKAAEGCGVIVHGVNYPYHQWVPYLQTATLNVIAAARASGATLLFPGNVYSLGPGAGVPIAETEPPRPNTRKGKFRLRLEGLLEDAAKPAGEAPPIRVLTVRAGDYFGPTARNGIVDRLYGNAARGKPITSFGRLDIVHERVFLPDLARASLDLLSLGGILAPYEVVNVTAEPHLSERAFMEAVARASGHPGLEVKLMPWWLVRLIGLVNPVIREFAELAYLYDTTVLLDGAKLKRLLPGFRFTPLDDALRQTIESYRR